MYKAKYVGITWQALVLAAATCVGVIGTLFFVTPLANRELVFVEMVKTLFSPLFAGFILCAVLAATMSVMTAQILATASIVADDFFKKMAGKQLSDKGELLLLRGCIIALPILAYVVSYNSTSSINDMVSYAWSGLGLSFAPAVIAALFIPSANKYGVGLAMLLGGITGMVWPSLNFGFMPLLPGFVIAIMLLTIVSYATRRRS
jgi:sodium/proline symporter